jgi:hypothetical protein
MSSAIQIVGIHGIGVQDDDFYDVLRKNLAKELSDLGITDSEIRGVMYADIAQANEDALWARIDEKTIALDSVRRFLLFYFGDAGVYGFKPGEKDSSYKKIHMRLAEELAAALGELTDDGSLVVLAQSFGAHVFSDFIWDHQKGKPVKKVPNLLSRLKLLVTTGCNLPLFVGGMKDVTPFGKPNDAFRWINYYDKDDVLGWPLKPLSPAYEQLVEQDVIVNAGLPIFSHLNYWKRSTVLQLIGQAIAAIA